MLTISAPGKAEISTAHLVIRKILSKLTIPSMQISKNQQLFGYPALEIRRLMQACRDTRWSIGVVGLTLHISRDRATELVEAMLLDGLVAKALDRECSREWLMTVEDPNGPRYVLTIKGNALASATAKPIRRSTAVRLVSSLLQRVGEVNGDPNLLHWVDEVVVFGSFLTESEMLGDVDLGLMYTRRNENPNDWDALSGARVKEAQANGRNFRNIFDKWGWPLREIELRLRNRSGSLSLHNLDCERTFIEALPHRQIYLRCNGTPTTVADPNTIMIDVGVPIGGVSAEKKKLPRGDRSKATGSERSKR